MSKIHHKIIKEIIEEQKNNPDIVVINIFGSVAQGLERPDSDVDIEVFSKKAKKWSLKRQKRYGIKIDFETAPLDKVLKRVKTHPYLCYDYMFEKIVYDPQGIMKNIVKKIKDYFKKNPEAKKYWDENNKLMRETKNSGKKPKDAYDVWDEAEIKFSKNHKITRDFFLRGGED
jgi:predicted nucleotidyltransferase